MNVSDKINNLLEQFGKLTVQESWELKDKMKEKFSLTYPVVPDAPVNLPVQEEEGIDQPIYLTLIPFGKKMDVMKALREHFSLGLMECKQVTDNLPALIVPSADKAKLEDIKSKFPQGCTFRHG